MTGSLDLDALEAVARAATPGPWKESGLDDEPTVIHYFDTEWSGPGYGPHVYPDKPEDAIFIAAFDPSTVLALIGRVREAEAAIARVRDLHGETRVAYSASTNGNVQFQSWCTACDRPYPCPTVRALGGEKC